MDLVWCLFLVEECIEKKCIHKDQNQMKKIHEEIGSDVDLERFDKLFEYATSKPYGFLAIDVNPKNPDHTFRCRFNEYLA